MAKGRRLTISLSERYLGSYSSGDGHGVNGADVSELGEEDIWSAVDDVVPTGGRNADDPRGAWTPRAANGSMGIGGSGGGRGIPGDGGRAGGLSLALMDSGVTASPRIVHQFRGNEAGVPSPRGRQLASSAPVNVPDWSKIYRADSVESLHDSDDTFDDGDAEMMPPHEYLAREHARNRKGAAATSVFEGVGRTLKGRDLRRIRDAVWSRTGFDG
ncbi:uncharacterized protein LOC115742922 [Rhodamnia argentea]|uniref:Uncharacterized protein LOC115742922 n=1 Tax=Rhodamnia argentea TaxID=178133 RepID=A0A8B8PEU1_9MYRT|nr:uncharacterized protein LOC115742922 [Rhodamnia argentea]